MIAMQTTDHGPRTTGLSAAIIEAAREAAPALAKLRGAVIVPFEPPSPTAKPMEVAWLYLSAPSRPHGLLKDLCAEHNANYDSVRDAVQSLRKRHRVL